VVVALHARHRIYDVDFHCGAPLKTKALLLGSQLAVLIASFISRDDGCTHFANHQNHD